MRDVHATDVPKLRYQRVGGGYRREDVEAALAHLLGTVDAVEARLDELRARSDELEARLGERELELEAYRAREAELEAVMRRAEAVLGDLNGASRED
jgi:chromosome segregation ATPase